MAPKKKTETKTKKAVTTAAEPKARAHKKAPAAKKKTAVKAAYAHSAAVSNRAAPAAAHPHTDHRSDSYKHYASIMRTIIVFLACVLALVILARIFIAPSDNQTAAAGDNSRMRFLGSAPSASGGGFYNLDGTNSGYIGYKDLRSQHGQP